MLSAGNEKLNAAAKQLADIRRRQYAKTLQTRGESK